MSWIDAGSKASARHPFAESPRGVNAPWKSAHAENAVCARNARYVWVEDDAPHRNQFVRFERHFDLSSLPATLRIHLFADTRFRLRVNGEFLAAGPGRFVTQFPEFDSHELAPLLRQGRNLISVEVNFFGASSFQSMPDGMPGFIAWGDEGGGVDLSTPGDWRALRMHAWRWDAPLFSFAQNPAEICDTRELEFGKAREPVILSGQRAPWPRPQPYTGTPIPYFLQRPKRIELAAALENGERRIGFMANDPNASMRNSDTPPAPWIAFATWIHSPRSQTARISCFWSELACNGEPVAVDTETLYGNHGHCILRLNSGWNLLTGQLEVLGEFWAYCLGIPHDLNLSLHGRRDLGCLQPLRLSPVMPRDQLCKILPTWPQISKVPTSWTLHDGDPMQITPARMMAWDEPSPGGLRDIPPASLAEVSSIEAAAATWCFSFEGEFLGYIVLDVDAPAGSVLDVATDDWQAPHGGVALYQSNPFTDSADRFILRGGRQRIELFHPRGGKFIQATLRSASGVAMLSLHDVHVRSRQSITDNGSSFSCSDPALTWAWPVAMRTLMVSTDESYSDCPWRERASYIGDCYVNLHLHLLLNNDLRTARRTLKIFGLAQLPDGQLPCCAPAWLRRPHEDFTLIWILALHDYWAATGDRELIREVWPVVQRIWESSGWITGTAGLWNADGKRLFVDWGVLQSEREGDANTTLNLFRFAAAKASASLARVLKFCDEAGRFDHEARTVEKALLLHVWNEAEGRFFPSLGSESPALHANTLALAFEVGNDPLRSRILRYLEPRLLKNFEQGIHCGQFSGHLELYFLFYLLPALAAHGRPDLAENLITIHHGFLRDLGDDTFPECFCRVREAVGSRCHSWSGAAAIHAARHVLGIRQTQPGNPDDLICDPLVHSISEASGRISHPRGWIEVAWTKVDGKMDLHFAAPPGVSIKTPGVERKANGLCGFS
jgi:alpha-L-rhamnosidase